MRYDTPVRPADGLWRGAVMRLVRGRWLAAIAVVAVVALPGTAVAQDRRLSSEPAVDAVDALDGTVIWTVGLPSGASRVVLLRPGARPFVTGVSLRTGDDPNLGLDGRGRMVVSYADCVPGGGCGPAVYDVATGRVRALRTRVPKGCRLHEVAAWRTRTALAVWCGSGRPPRQANRVLVAHNGTLRSLSAPGTDTIDLRGDIVAGYSSKFRGLVRLLAHGRATCRTTVDRGSESPAGSYGISSPRIGPSGVTWLADSRLDERNVFLRSASIGRRCSVEKVVSPALGPDLLAGSSLTGDKSFTSAVRDGAAIYYTVRGAGVFRRDGAPA